MLPAGVFVVIRVAVDTLADSQPIPPDHEPTADIQAICEDTVVRCCSTYLREDRHTPAQQATTT